MRPRLRYGLMLAAFAVALVFVTGSGGTTTRVSLTGTWVVKSSKLPGGFEVPNYIWELVDKDGVLSGTVGCACEPAGKVPLTGSGVAGGAVRVQWLNSEGESAVFTGTVDAAGRKMSGTWTATPYTVTLTWTAERKGFPVSGKVVGFDCSLKACKRKPLSGVKVRLAGASLDETVSTDTQGRYEFFLPGAGQYRITAALPGYAFAPAARSMTLERETAGLDFRTCVSKGASSGAKRVTASVGKTKGPFCRNLFAANISDRRVLVPVRVEYRGVGWDPEGGPITIKWEGKPIKRLPQAESFDGTILGTDWPRRSRFDADPPRCYGKLAAAQAGLERPVEISATTTGFVLFADLDPNFSSGQVYCGEEKTILKFTPGTIIGVQAPSGLLMVFQRGQLIGPLSVDGKLCKELTKKRGYVIVTRVGKAYRYERSARPCT